MVSILMDLDTGDPVLDDYNNTIQVEQEYAFKQIINGLFNCELGSELMHQNYGFPLSKAIRESSVPNSEMFIESLVAQSLNPEVEKLIDTLDYLKAEKSGNTMIVTVKITSVLNDTITMENLLTEI